MQELAVNLCKAADEQGLDVCTQPTCSVNECVPLPIRSGDLRVNGVAGGATDAAYNAALPAHQGIENARLAHVGAPHNSHSQGLRALLLHLQPSQSRLSV